MVFPPDPLPPRPPRRWQALGERIAAARETHAWTAHQLTGLLDMHVVTVRLWETGHNRPRRHTLHRLATLLDIPYAELAALAHYPGDAEDAG